MSSTQMSEAKKNIEPENDPRLSQRTKEFLKVLNTPAPPELEKMSPEYARAVLAGAQKSVDVNYSGIEESEKTINAGGFEIKLNIVRPQGVTEKLPVFIFIHGGGWVLGDYPTHKRMVRDLVVLSGFYDMYIPEPEKRKEIYASPLQATIEQLKGLPPALVITGESDVLRDEGEAYARKLDEAGVKVTNVRYSGMIHDFGLLNGLAELPQVHTLFEQSATELKKYLGE